MLLVLNIEYSIYVVETIPNEGWDRHAERVDQILAMMKRVPFTVSVINQKFLIFNLEWKMYRYFKSEISDY